MVYFGQVSNVGAYFASYGFRCPFGFNMADFLLDVVSVNPKNHDSEITKVVASYRMNSSEDPSKLAEDVGNLLKGHTTSSSDCAEDNPCEKISYDLSTGSARLQHHHSTYAASFQNQVSVLLYRNFLNFLRHPSIFWGQLIIHILFGVISGSIFSGIKNSSAGAVVGGAQFDIGTLLFWMVSFCALLTFSAVPQCKYFMIC